MQVELSEYALVLTMDTLRRKVEDLSASIEARKNYTHRAAVKRTAELKRRRDDLAMIAAHLSGTLTAHCKALLKAG